MGVHPSTLAAILAGAAGPVTTQITTADQSVATSGVAYTLTAVSSASSLTWTADGGSIGTSSRGSGNSHSISWTPGGVDYLVSIVADDGAVTSTITMMAAEANRMPALTSWTRTGIGSPTTGVADPDGGTAAVTFTASVGATSSYIAGQASSAPSTVLGGMEVWVKPGTCRYLQVYPIEDGGTHNGVIDLVTGQCRARFLSLAIVERRGDWVRLLCQYQNAAAGPRNFWLRMAASMSSTTLSGAGTESISVYQPRQLDGAVYMTDYQRISFDFVSNQTGFERWQYNSPLMYTQADTDLNRWTVDIIKPAGWTQSGAYRAIYLLPALVRASEDVAPIAVAAGIADSTGCVVIIPYIKDSRIPWYGMLANGTGDQHRVMACLPQAAQQHFGVAASRSSHMLLGYSKAGWGALSLLLRNPTIFGAAYAWDVPWSLISTWPTPDYGQSLEFTTQAQMALYDPITLIGSLSSPSLALLSDKKRIGIAGYHTFQSHQAAMQSALTAAGIPFDYLQSSAAGHSYSSGWLAAAAATLAAY